MTSESGAQMVSTDAWSDGVSVIEQVERLDGLQHMCIPVGQQYRSPGAAYVEGDASSASYFLAGATITGTTALAQVSGWTPSL